MQTTQQAFLADICRQPQRDDLRLIFADWLEDEGEWQRAAYIRTRVEWDTLPECGHDWLLRPGGWKCHTCRRKDELFSAWTNEDGFPPWELLLPKWMKLPGVKSLDVSMSRGFPSHVTLTEADWLKHGEALVKAAPIEGVTLSDKRPASGTDGRFYWDFVLADLEPSPHDLDVELLALTMECGCPLGCRFHEGEVSFPTVEQSNAALSSACVALARQRAGLPALGS